MTKKVTNKKDLVKKLNELSRKLSTRTILFHQLIAQTLGMSGPDHKYLDILLQEGKMTAGELSKLTGLTTGAITGIVDRLEKMNLVVRERDLVDRRKVYITPNEKVAFQKIAPVFESLSYKLGDLYNDFNLEEINTLIRYHEKSIFILEDILTNKKI